ncbi:MAG: hypothetical protein AABY51_07600 [Deltaproteobacteria bacterium]
MFPRNIRSIYPWKMAQIQALMIHAIQRGDWEQRIQNSFCSALENAGLKSRGVQYDPHSGGPRTYLSQLKCLGLLFSRDDGSIFPTLAGKDLADGKPPLPILQQMLLDHQYPSAYSRFQNVRINPQLKVKPFLFVLELLHCPEINYLSNAELSIPVIYGHNHDCLDICRDKIIRLRNGATFTSIIDNSVEDIYLPRSRSDFELDLANIRDIANTCKNYLKACCLVYEDSSSGEQRILFNDDVSELYESAVQRKESFITKSTEESFQRAYGAWNKRKDTRRLVNEDAVNPNGAKAGIILSSFYSLCGHDIITELPNDFIDTMATNYGFSKNEIVEVIEPHLNSAIDYYESTFLDSARGGVATALTFEKSLKDLMDKKFNFFAKHTGQILRNGVGGYADVFIVADDYNNCAILDAKASPSYAISSEDYSKLVSNYIPHYKELIDKFDELRGRDISLEFCSYVAGGFSGNIAYKLSEASRATGVPCSAIRARDLLNLAKSGTAQLDIRNGMKNIKLLGVEDF